jgi:hypothetical protein
MVLLIIIGLCGAELAVIAYRVIEGFHDPPLGDVVLAVEAADVGAQQYLDAVSRPLGDLSGRHSPVEPCRQACVAQVVGATCQRGRVIPRAECGLASPLPCPAIGDRREQAAFTPRTRGRPGM